MWVDMLDWLSCNSIDVFFLKVSIIKSDISDVPQCENLKSECASRLYVFSVENITQPLQMGGIYLLLNICDMCNYFSPCVSSATISSSLSIPFFKPPKYNQSL